MAGHSKWSNIKHRKGAQDAKRAKIFTKIIKEITISSRLGGGDLDSNPRLRKAVTNGKASNLPADKIERAIKKGTGELQGVFYDEISYEGFGPGGFAIILNVITDNKNRSVAEIRHLLSKYGGNLGANGSVSWMFEKKGSILIDKNSCDESKLFNFSIDCDAEDFTLEDDFFNIQTIADQLMIVRDQIEEGGYSIHSAEVDMVPKQLHSVNDDEFDLSLKLLNALDDNDDINKLYTNIELINY